MDLLKIAHQEHGTVVASLVSPTQDDRLIARLLQELGQKANQGSLARASHRQVPHADDRMVESVRLQDSFLVEKDPKGNDQAVDFGQ